jgi:membrane associated rhomboid family serine protease
VIPLRDENPTSRRPVVTWFLVLACVAVFLVQTGLLGGVLGGAQSDLVADYALVPERVFAADHHAVVEMTGESGGVRRVVIGPTALARWLPARLAEWCTLLTCIFLHGSWLHLLGNVWVLLVFGDNVEDRFGRLRYLLFYLVCGVGASAVHLLSDPGSSVPTVGASGAIAGVMGSYLLLYPHARVLTLIPFVLPFLVVLPASLFLGFWFLMQFLHGAVEKSEVGGVAWMAHIGGFASGLAITAGLRVLGLLRPPTAPIALRAWRPRY